MSPAPPSLPLLLAERYAVQSHLGAGGMADVYLARDLKLQRTVAVKILRPDGAGAVGPRRFLKEIEIAATLSHPHLVPVYDSGEIGDLLWYVMAYVEGESLRKRLKREHTLAVDEAVRLTCEIAEGLEYAHARGFVHRDIKPENVLLQDGHALVSDFGIARALSEVTDAERLTSTGVTVGTAHYMSPEQATGERNVDARSDIYALGCVLYEMLVGEPPFTGASMRAVVARQVTQVPPSIRVVRPDVPEALERIVMKALAKMPSDRWRTAEEMRAALLAVVERTGSARGVGVEVGRTRHSARLAASLVIGVLAIGAVTWLVGQRDEGTSPLGTDRYRIAVYPLRVQGSADAAYLGEGLMDLLSAAVDGLGELRSVDPHALMSRLRQEGLTAPLDPAVAERLSRELGAGLHVLGSILEVGDELSISASLYDSTEGIEPVAEAMERGPVDRIPILVEAIVKDLLAAVPLGSGGRLADLSTVAAGVGDFEVLRAYLEGEAFIRVGQYQAAQRSLERAVDADSTFALAWYRLSMSEGAGSGNGGRHRDGGEASLVHALEHAERLAPRDSLLVAAFHAIRVGEAERAEALAQSATSRYPDDVEAWFALGDTWFVHGWSLGRSFADAMRPLARALELDPGYTPAALRYTHAAEVEHRYDEMPRYLAAYPTYDGGDVLVRLSLALGAGDVAGIDSLVVAVERLPEARLYDAPEAMAEADSIELARALLGRLASASDRAPALQAWARFNWMLYAMASGQWSEAGSALRDPAMQALASHLPVVYALAALPFLERPREELVALRETLESLELGSYENTTPLPFERPLSLHPWLKEYALGMLSASLGEEAAAAAYARELEMSSVPPDPQGLRMDMALDIRALSSLAQGRHADALRLLEQAEYRVMSYFPEAFNPYMKRPFGRYLRAEALRELGRDEEALKWYATFGFTNSPDGVFWAPVFLGRAEIHERRGEAERALHYYRRFLARWRSADAEYQPLLKDVEARVARLERSGG